MSGIKTTTANQEEMAVWKNLKDTLGWRKAVGILRKKVDEADLIINQIGGDRKLEYTMRDLSILKKNAYLDLIEMPEKMIESLAGTGVIEEPEEMDPFSDEIPETQSEATDDL